MEVNYEKNIFRLFQGLMIDDYLELEVTCMLLTGSLISLAGDKLG